LLLRCSRPGAIDGARGILINITGSASLKLAEVQQACTIIQSAAHEDANIIFGAVMDEKMKDAVKITVIATGFREVPGRNRPAERITRLRHRMTMPWIFLSPWVRRNPRRRLFPSPCLNRMMEEHRMAEASPAPHTRGSAEVISLDSMRSAMVANFEQEDLDVPAFLRKRGEVM
jgi:cell division protein FtsZ